MVLKKNTKLLFALASLTFLINLLILKEVDLIEEYSLNQRSYKVKIEAVTNGANPSQFDRQFGISTRLPYFDSLSDSTKMNVRIAYFWALKEISDEIKLEQLNKQNEHFVFGLSFMFGLGLFTEGGGRRLNNVFQLERKGESMSQYYRGVRAYFEVDPSPKHIRITAFIGKLLGKHIGFSTSFALIIIGIGVNLRNKKRDLASTNITGDNKT